VVQLVKMVMDVMDLGLHGAEDIDGPNSVWTSGKMKTSQRNKLYASSRLKNIIIIIMKIVDVTGFLKSREFIDQQAGRSYMCTHSQTYQHTYSKFTHTHTHTHARTHIHKQMRAYLHAFEQ
jgi:hypothetical protein